MKNQIQTQIKVSYTKRDRLSVFFRLIYALPVAAFIAIISQFSPNAWGPVVLFSLPIVLSLLFTGIYPSYFLNFNKDLLGLGTRFLAYLYLLTDKYPSIEDSQVVKITFPEINGGKKLNRFLPLIKWLLALPLAIVGFVYLAIAILLTLIAWVYTFITASYPKWAGEFVYKTFQYWNRVLGYAVILVTDEYPSFKL
ncbi:MAG: hypothetical protein RIQ80_652 [Actinomycetota bacterium]|jgi:hypothetical protein|nr:DUF4389 domain-containing protein [Actinomycetota bacterium]